MTKTPRALIAGESWTVLSIHQRDFDGFAIIEHARGIGWPRAAFGGGG